MEKISDKLTADRIAGLVAIIIVIVMIFINAGKINTESNEDRRGPVQNAQ